MADFVLRPQDQFQKFHPTERLEWAQMSSNRSLQLAFNYAIAEMGVLGCTQEQMKGANLFMHFALNLSKEVTPLEERYPAQPLQDETIKPVPV